MGYRAGFVAVALVALAGCTPKVVILPVASCPAPIIGENPKLPVGDLTQGSAIGDVVQAYAASLELCKGRVNELIKKLEGYNKP